MPSPQKRASNYYEEGNNQGEAGFDSDQKAKYTSNQRIIFNIYGL